MDGAGVEVCDVGWENGLCGEGKVATRLSLERSSNVIDVLLTIHRFQDLDLHAPFVFPRKFSSQLNCRKFHPASVPANSVAGKSDCILTSAPARMVRCQLRFVGRDLVEILTHFRFGRQQVACCESQLGMRLPIFVASSRPARFAAMKTLRHIGLAFVVDVLCGAFFLCSLTRSPLTRIPAPFHIAMVPILGVSYNPEIRKQVLAGYMQLPHVTQVCSRGHDTSRLLCCRYERD